MKLLLNNLSRLLTGAVFVFSGFVKGVDPWGTAYKLEDYFMVYGMEWANGYALFLSILLCAVEFAIGAALLFNLRMQLTAWLLLLMMSFFTLLTFYDALYDPVPDCGCFGDAIKLSNWATFYKNLILMAPTVWIFCNRNKFSPFLNPKRQTITAVAFLIGFSAFSYYYSMHLPLIDFREWKLGNKMTANETADDRVYVIYQNKVSGDRQEYLSPDFPWNDSIWMSQWEFVDQRIEKDQDELIHNLMAEDANGNDFTDLILQSPGILVVVAPDLTNASAKGMKRIAAVEKSSIELAIPLVVLTSNLPEEAEQLINQYGMQTDTFFADDIVLKTMIRSNPGLMLFYNGYVAGKWHYNDLPDENKLQRIIENMPERYPD